MLDILSRVLYVLIGTFNDFNGIYNISLLFFVVFKLLLLVVYIMAKIVKQSSKIYNV